MNWKENWQREAVGQLDKTFVIEEFLLLNIQSNPALTDPPATEFHLQWMQIYGL